MYYLRSYVVCFSTGYQNKKMSILRQSSDTGKGVSIVGFSKKYFMLDLIFYCQTSERVKTKKSVFEYKVCDECVKNVLIVRVVCVPLSRPHHHANTITTTASTNCPYHHTTKLVVHTYSRARSEDLNGRAGKGNGQLWEK